MSNSLDLDQDRQNVGPELDPNCLQRLLADIKSSHLATGGERVITMGSQQSKTLILSTNVDKKWLETMFLIAICHPNGDKWQSKTLLLAILIRVCQLLRVFSIATFPVWLWYRDKRESVYL